MHTTERSYRILRLTASIFFSLHTVDIVYHILAKCTTVVPKKSVFWRKEKVQHKNEECVLCDACVSLQSREKSNRGGEARGGMIVISAVRFEMLRWQISAVSARSDADRYQHTLAITPPSPCMDTTTSRGSDEPTDSKCCKLTDMSVFLERI